MIPTFARLMLKVFALLGCDFLPTFYGVSHSLGMEVFMKIFKEVPVRTPNDFLNLMLTLIVRGGLIQPALFSDGYFSLKLKCWRAQIS